MLLILSPKKLWLLFFCYFTCALMWHKLNFMAYSFVRYTLILNFSLILRQVLFYYFNSIVILNLSSYWHLIIANLLLVLCNFSLSWYFLYPLSHLVLDYAPLVGYVFNPTFRSRCLNSRFILNDSTAFTRRTWLTRSWTRWTRRFC